MKTIYCEDLDTYKRVSDDEAPYLVSTGQWHYCPKRLWKENVRGI